MGETIPSPKELTKLCREWQERLRLQDWRIQVRYTKEYELDGKAAQARMVSDYKQALILVNPYAEHRDFGVDPVEVCLLHELVHLHLDLLMPKDISGHHHVLYEQATDLLAWALYRAKYGEKAVDEFVGES